MGELAKEWDLPAYAKQRIRIRATGLVGHFWLTWADLPDIEQRLATDVWDGLRKYDPTRGDLDGFIYVLVEKARGTLVEAELAQKRRAERAVRSMDSAIAGPDGRSTTVAAVTEAGEAGRRQGLALKHSTTASDLAMDVHAFMEGLHGELRDLCERLLDGQNFTDIHDETGIPRGTLYERRAELHRLMEAAGLADYLPASGASQPPPVESQ